MTDHRHSDDGKYQESRFEDVLVRVNFDVTSREGLAPKSFQATQKNWLITETVENLHPKDG